MKKNYIKYPSRDLWILNSNKKKEPCQHSNKQGKFIDFFLFGNFPKKCRFFYLKKKFQKQRKRSIRNWTEIHRSINQLKNARQFCSTIESFKIDLRLLILISYHWLLSSSSSSVFIIIIIVGVVVVVVCVFSASNVKVLVTFLVSLFSFPFNFFC